MRHYLGILILTLIATIATSAPVGLYPMDRLLREAKLIVVARVIHGTQSGTVASVTLQVQRTLQGSEPAGAINASATVPNAPSATRMLSGLQGIWFLAEDARGNYTILPAIAGSVPLEFCILPALPVLPASWAWPPSATPSEKIIRELAAAIENNSLSPFAAERLARPPAEPAASFRELYRRMLSSPSPIVAQSGLAGLIRGGDSQAIEELGSRSRPDSATGGASLSVAVCEYFNGNPRGLSVLAQLAGPASPIPSLRSCAAFALRNIHSKESLPYLAALLDSDDSDIRYQGMAGLASFANTGFVPRELPLLVDGVVRPRTARSLRTPETGANFPTADVFRRDEARFVSFWKQWMKENADKLQ